MSDTSQGQGWWLASDGKWYPPELWTGPPETRPGGATSEPTTTAAPQTPTAGLQWSADAAGPAAPTGPPASPYATPAAGQYPPQVHYPSQYPGQPASQYPGQPGSQYGTPYPSAYPGQPGTPNPGQYAPQGYVPGAPYGQPATAKTNGLAIAGLVCSIAGLIFFAAIAGVVFGFISRAQIKKSNGLQKGSGMALAAIIVGFGWLAILVLIIAVGATHPANTNNGDIVTPGILLRLGISGLFN